MSSGELLLTLLVALLVFNPKKLPMLARHLAKIISRFHYLKQQAFDVWQKQINELQLHENQRQAEQADELYAAKKHLND